MQVELYLASALDGREWSASHPCFYLPPEKKPLFSIKKRPLGPGAGLDIWEKLWISFPSQDISNSDNYI